MIALSIGTLALQSPAPSRRQVVAGTVHAALGAELAWSQAVAAAAAAGISAPEDMNLPPGTIEQIEAGRIVVVKNWLPSDELAALRSDAEAAFAAGHFKADALATYGQKPKAGFDPSHDRMVMPSFYPSKGLDGPWVDSSIGNAAVRLRFKQRMGAVKAALSRSMQGRESLIADGAQTHEMSYTRYGPGAFLARHTDEHHSVLKLNSKPKPTRRSVSWLVYLNEGWASKDGGALRVHERIHPSASPVGARGADLQVGWLRGASIGASANEGDTPVFLDANCVPSPGQPPEATCVLYASGATGERRNLSAKPFAASPALYLSGGDFFARKLLVDSPSDARRFHLVDAPKSAASAFLPPPEYGERGEDGGEQVLDVLPEGGTLVLFDSVSLPHEVMPTVGRERFACSGWFHEQQQV
jgi:Rps23 Pro-64 3,4-dihydroxylase Tpa1-like proline 4-hydroxylase